MGSGGFGFPRGMRKRWWMFRPIDWLCACLPRRRGGGLLLVRMDGIGDMALFQPYVDAYREALGYSREQTTILGCDSWRALGPSLFPGYRLETIAEKRFEKSFLYRLKVCLRLRRAGYDTAVAPAFFRKVMLHDSLVLATGAAERIVARATRSRRTQREFDWTEARMTRVIATGEHPTHEIVRHRRFVEAASGRPLPPVKLVDWPIREVPVATDRPYAVLNFGSNEPGRNWPLDNYLDLGERLLAAGVTPVFVGGARETAAKAKIAERFPDGRAVDLIGATSLIGLIDVMRRAALTVSNETGPGHLAILVGTPTVMIYGGGHAGSFMPYPEAPETRHAAFAHVPMECYHCLWLCRYPHRPADPFPCIAAVPVDAVWAEVAPRLPGAPAP